MMCSCLDVRPDPAPPLDMRVGGLGIGEHQAVGEFGVAGGEVGGFGAQVAQIAAVMFEVGVAGGHLFLTADSSRLVNDVLVFECQTCLRLSNSCLISDLTPGFINGQIRNNYIGRFSSRLIEE